MGMKSFLGIATVVLAPLCAGAAAFLLMAGLYVAAFWAMAAVVVAMETRVRLGHRNPRRALFYVHLIAGVLLMCTLAALAFFAASPLWVLPTLLLWAVVTISGGVLIARQF